MRDVAAKGTGPLDLLAGTTRRRRAPATILVLFVSALAAAAQDIPPIESDADLAAAQPKILEILERHGWPPELLELAPAEDTIHLRGDEPVTGHLRSLTAFATLELPRLGITERGAAQQVEPQIRRFARTDIGFIFLDGGTFPPERPALPPDEDAVVLESGELLAGHVEISDQAVMVASRSIPHGDVAFVHLRDPHAERPAGAGGGPGASGGDPRQASGGAGAPGMPPGGGVTLPPLPSTGSCWLGELSARAFREFDDGVRSAWTGNADLVLREGILYDYPGDNLYLALEVAPGSSYTLTQEVWSLGTITMGAHNDGHQDAVGHGGYLWRLTPEFAAQLAAGPAGAMEDDQYFLSWPFHPWFEQLVIYPGGVSRSLGGSGDPGIHVGSGGAAGQPGWHDPEKRILQDDGQRMAGSFEAAEHRDGALTTVAASWSLERGDCPEPGEEPAPGELPEPDPDDPCRISRYKLADARWRLEQAKSGLHAVQAELAPLNERLVREAAVVESLEAYFDGALALALLNDLSLAALETALFDGLAGAAKAGQISRSVGSRVRTALELVKLYLDPGGWATSKMTPDIVQQAQDLHKYLEILTESTRGEPNREASLAYIEEQMFWLGGDYMVAKAKDYVEAARTWYGTLGEIRRQLRRSLRLEYQIDLALADIEWYEEELAECEEESG